jgi:hypothetical protein
LPPRHPRSPSPTVVHTKPEQKPPTTFSPDVVDKG